MTKLPTLLAAATVALATAPLAEAQITVVAYGTTPTSGNTAYVTANTGLQRTASNIASGNYRLSYSDTSAMSPASGYTGPTFYGGFEALTNGTTGQGNTGVAGTQRLGNSTPDSIQLGSSFVLANAWSASTSASVAGFVSFLQPDWRDSTGAASELNSGNVNISSLATTYTIASGNPSYNSGVVTRWVVKGADGQYYISQSSPTSNASGITTASVNVASSNWAAITPATSGSLNLDLASLDYSVSGSSMSATALGGVGLYFENDSFTSNDTLNTRWFFQLNSLGFTATAAIPEPSATALLVALGGLAFAAARRQRRAKVD